MVLRAPREAAASHCRSGAGAHGGPSPAPSGSRSAAPALAGVTRGGHARVSTRPSVRKRFGVPDRTPVGTSLAPRALVPKKHSRPAHAVTPSWRSTALPTFPSAALVRPQADPCALSPAGAEEAREHRAPRDRACLPAPSARRAQVGRAEGQFPMVPSFAYRM